MAERYTYIRDLLMHLNADTVPQAVIHESASIYGTYRARLPLYVFHIGFRCDVGKFFTKKPKNMVYIFDSTCGF